MAGREKASRSHTQSSIKAEQPAISSRLIKNNQKWDSLKDDTHRLYIVEDSTLPVTMDTIERTHGFKASERKWKDKLKGWGFDKNIPAKDMQILVAKAEKRARDDGKETVFLHGGSELGPERFEHFKRRKTTQAMEAVSPSAETPSNITYHTPGPNSEDPSFMSWVEETGARIPVSEDSSFQYHRHGSSELATAPIQNTDLNGPLSMADPSLENPAGRDNLDPFCSDRLGIGSIGFDTSTPPTELLMNSAGILDSQRTLAGSLPVNIISLASHPALVHLFPDEIDNQEYQKPDLNFSTLSVEQIKEVSGLNLEMSPVSGNNLSSMGYETEMFPFPKTRSSDPWWLRGLQFILSLARLFEKTGELQMAESYYRGVLEAFKEAEHMDDYQILQAEFYPQDGRSFVNFVWELRDRNETLIPLVLALFIRETSAWASNFRLARERHTENLLRLFEKLYPKIDHSRVLKTLLPHILAMANPRWESTEDRYTFANLARELSVLGMFDLAEHLFVFATSKRWEHWEAMHWPLRDSYAHGDYAAHCQRQKKWAKSVTQLKMAFDCQWRVSSRNIPDWLVQKQKLGYLLDIAQGELNAAGEINELHIQKAISDAEKARRSHRDDGLQIPELESSRTVTPFMSTPVSTSLSSAGNGHTATIELSKDTRSHNPPEIREDLRDSNSQNDDDNFSTVWTTSTKSYKYGVTYSVSDINGISDSGFMVP